MLDSSSEVNAINPNFVQKLGLKVQKTNIRAQKIDSSALKTLKIVIADFQIENKTGRPRFFQEIFLMIDITFEVILEIFFLKLSNADVLFGEEIPM